MLLPEGHAARAVVPHDEGRVLPLLNAASRASCGAEDFTPAMLHKAWTAPGLDLARDTRLLLGPDGAACGYAELWWRAPGAVTDLWIAVAPSHPARVRLAGALLAWGEARARAACACAPPGVELLLHVEADEDAADVRAALAVAGFGAVRTTCRLQRTLDAREPADGAGRSPWPAGLSLSTLRPGLDEAAACAAQGRAFRDHWGVAEEDPAEALARFAHWMAADPDFDPSLFWLLREGDAVAAFLFAFPACESARDTARIPSLGVLRPWRRRGLAHGLLSHAFAALGARGCRRVVLEADADSLTGALALYTGAGMTVCRRFRTWRKVLRSGARAVTESVAAED
ncbi:MAG TPA: GNAT family N-acetyltransferase [Planctomycetota bacterium]|nr:GNAT family N-acetyltransferase [Planctomycetota bacterium]